MYFSFVCRTKEKYQKKKPPHRFALRPSKRVKTAGCETRLPNAGSNSLRPFFRFHPFSRRQNEWGEELPPGASVSSAQRKQAVETVSAGQKRVFFVTFFWQDKRKLIPDVTPRDGEKYLPGKSDNYCQILSWYTRLKKPKPSGRAPYLPAARTSGSYSVSPDPKPLLSSCLSPRLPTAYRRA